MVEKVELRPCDQSSSWKMKKFYTELSFCLWWDTNIVCEELKQQSDGSAPGKMSNSISSTGKEVSSTQGRRSLLFKHMNIEFPWEGNSSCSQSQAGG